MSFVSDGTGARPWSILALLRRPGLETPSVSPTQELQALLAREARLPTSGGLFGSGYARYMADNAPPETSVAGAPGCGADRDGSGVWPARGRRRRRPAGDRSGAVLPGRRTGEGQALAG